MGLFDQLAGGLGGELLKQLGGNQQNQMMQMVMGLLQQPGGLQGLIDKFQQAGLGPQMASWVGTGANLPVDGTQIHQALGSDWMANLASQLGTSPEQASQSIAGVLPGLIDKLTPGGNAADANSMMTGDLQSLLKSKLFG